MTMEVEFMDLNSHVLLNVSQSDYW